MNCGGGGGVISTPKYENGPLEKIRTVLSPYVLGLVYTIRVTRYPHHFFLTLVWRRRERDGTRASESHWSRSVFRTPCHSGARKVFHLAPPFGQKEARNEHSELGSLFTIRVTRRSRPVSTYGDNTVFLIFPFSKTYPKFKTIGGVRQFFSWILEGRFNP